jgi:2,4-dienoyl-CoA reductase-like NADH-dependent reductase (Old Yellow Enzyme family)
VITEATAVEARGRISPQDLGIYLDEHVEGLARINSFMKEHGAATGIQIAHAGRKASTLRPWDGSGKVPPEEGGWATVAPSAIPFSDLYPQPEALTRDGIQEILAAFRKATERSLAAGFDLIELHAAHGYLLHQFLSPGDNHRTDLYGGSLQNRARLKNTIGIFP